MWQVYFVVARVVCYSLGVTTTRPYCLYYLYWCCHLLRVITSPEQRRYDQRAASRSRVAVCIWVWAAFWVVVSMRWVHCVVKARFWQAEIVVPAGRVLADPYFQADCLMAVWGILTSQSCYSFIESHLYSHLRVVRLFIVLLFFFVSLCILT